MHLQTSPARCFCCTASGLFFSCRFRWPHTRWFREILLPWLMAAIVSMCMRFRDLPTRERSTRTSFSIIFSSRAASRVIKWNKPLRTNCRRFSPTFIRVLHWSLDCSIPFTTNRHLCVRCGRFFRDCSARFRK